MIVGATGADVAVPESVMIAVGSCGSLLMIVMLPESVPAAVGAKDTFKMALPPGAMVLGVAIPEIPKGVPLTEINERARFAPPEFVIVSAPLVVDPTVVLPKFRLLVLNVICCGAVAAPVRATEPDKTPVLVCSVIVPVAVPAAVGSNHTWNALDCPTGRDRGVLRPVTEYGPLVTVAELMMTAVFPVLATEAESETFWPTTTLPKLRLPGVTWIEACDGGGAFVAFALTSPEQPLIKARGVRARSANRVRSGNNFLDWWSRLGVPGDALRPSFARLFRRLSFAGRTAAWTHKTLSWDDPPLFTIMVSSGLKSAWAGGGLGPLKSLVLLALTSGEE